jgi:hypothetical protein
MSWNFARFYAAISILISLTIIAAPGLVALNIAPNALFREILMAAFPVWFAVSLVAIPVLRKRQLPPLAPASFVLLVVLMFGCAAFVGETNAPRQVSEFWVPAFMWLFMFYFATINWLLFANAEY